MDQDIDYLLNGSVVDRNTDPEYTELGVVMNTKANCPASPTDIHGAIPYSTDKPATAETSIDEAVLNVDKVVCCHSRPDRHNPAPA